MNAGSGTTATGRPEQRRSQSRANSSRTEMLLSSSQIMRADARLSVIERTTPD
jgi:hypothetical protein